MMTPYHERKHGNILIVDDTPENLAILTSMLTEHGYFVRPAINGEVALKAVQKHLPDLILLDIMMPKMSGYEVCEQLKADAQTRDIPVIFISALNKVFDKVKAFSIGGVDYITKPFQIEEVLARVETHLVLRQLYLRLQEQNEHLAHEVRERTHAEEALKESFFQIERAKQEWETTADSLSYVIALLDGKGHLLRVNRTVEQWELGQVEAVKGRTLHTLFHPECSLRPCYLQDFLTQAWEEISQDVSIVCDEWDPILHRYLKFQIRPIVSQASKNGQHAGSFAVGVVSDITRRKQAEVALKQHNYGLDVLNKMSDDLQACRMEAETYQVLAHTLQDIFPYDSGALYLAFGETSLLQSVIAWGAHAPALKEFPQDACLCLSQNKPYVFDDLNAQPACRHLDTAPATGYFCMPIGTPDQIIGVLHVIFGASRAEFSVDPFEYSTTNRQSLVTRIIKHYALALLNLRLRETLRIESIRDPLTNLYNRRYMEESLERETQRARRRGTPVSILMFDIDHFKRLNDTYGHEAGDVVLQKLGTLFRKHTRSEDVACRYGGEEFLLIMPETSFEIVQQRAEELRRTVKQQLRIPWQQHILAITISIGIAAFPLHGATVKEVVSAADGALYQAKANGRDRVAAAAIKEERM